MTGRRIAAADRRNARRSTGPRSAAGKQRAAGNSLRHGLSLPVLADPALAPEIAELAEQLAQEQLAQEQLAQDLTDPHSADPKMRELAVRVAETQVDVQRVRHARHAVFARPGIGTSVTGPRIGRLRDAIRELVALDRYERRAMWRRKLAMRAWQAALFRNRVMPRGDANDRA